MYLYAALHYINPAHITRIRSFPDTLAIYTVDCKEPIVVEGPEATRIRAWLNARAQVNHAA